MGVDKHPPQSKRTKPQYAFQYELIHAVWADTLQSSKAWGLVASQVAAELLKVTRDESRGLSCGLQTIQGTRLLGFGSLSPVGQWEVTLHGVKMFSLPAVMTHVLLAGGTQPGEAGSVVSLVLPRGV